MPEHHIRIDPRNPGAFLACCGLFELAEMLSPGGEACFDDDGAVFILATDAPVPPPRPTLVPQTDLVSDATLEPLVVEMGSARLRLNWWLNETEAGKSALKTWGGQQTPRRVLGEVLGQLPNCHSVETIFDTPIFTTTRFGVDARSAWEPLDFGYSPNDEQSKAAKQAVTFPWVEALAVIGLQGFRPSFERRRGPFHYATWLSPLPLLPARAACAVPWSGLGSRCFRFEIVSRGQGYKTFTFAQGVDDVRTPISL